MAAVVVVVRLVVGVTKALAAGGLVDGGADVGAMVAAGTVDAGSLTGAVTAGSDADAAFDDAAVVAGLDAVVDVLSEPGAKPADRDVVDVGGRPPARWSAGCLTARARPARATMARKPITRYMARRPTGGPAAPRRSDPAVNGGVGPIGP